MVDYNNDDTSIYMDGVLIGTNLLGNPYADKEQLIRDDLDMDLTVFERRSSSSIDSSETTSKTCGKTSMSLYLLLFILPFWILATGTLHHIQHPEATTINTYILCSGVILILFNIVLLVALYSCHKCNGLWFLFWIAVLSFFVASIMFITVACVTITTDWPASKSYGQLFIGLISAWVFTLILFVIKLCVSPTFP